MKALLVSLALIPMASAQLPTILGTIPNRDNNNITFTSDKGSCKADEKLAYTQGDGGAIGFFGCYKLIDSQVFVTWSDGSIYAYPFEAIRWSKEFQDYVARQK